MNKTQTISILDYKKTVLTLKENLQQLGNFSQQLGLTEISEQSQHLSHKLADNGFSIAVFGEFNKGKSTFINALIGQEVLPTDILATTATTTRIIHKRYIGAKICFKNGHEKDIPLKELTNYITKLSENSTARSANIKEAIISYPLPFAQENHIEIVDTPGLNDDAEMTGRTLSIIQNCDIAIMVISAQTPFSMSEVEFLKKLLNQGIAKILFVVNQIDLYSSIDAQRIIEMIDKKLKKLIQEWTEENPNNKRKNNLPQVFGISALKALQARQSKNMELFTQSNFANLELELKKIINEQLNIIRLEQITQKIDEFSRKIATKMGSKNIDIESSQMQLKTMSDSLTEKIKQIKIVKTNMAQSLNSLDSSLSTQLSALNYSFVDNLKQKAREVITSTTIDADQFNKDLEGFQKNLSNHIVSKLDKYSKHLARDINQNSKKSLNSSWNMLKNFSEEFQAFIEYIDSEIIPLKYLDEMIPLRASNIGSFIEREYKDCGRSPPSLSLSFPGNSNTFMIDYTSNVHNLRFIKALKS